MTPSATAPAERLHRAARLEDVVHDLVVRVLRRRGWAPRVLPYAGYGSGGRVRVLGRVLLCPPGSRHGALENARGWRRFFCAYLAGVSVEVEIEDRTTVVVSARGGYLDVVIEADPAPGPGQAVLRAGPVTSAAPLFIVPPDADVGLVSDIDDTVVITWLPRPLHAFWNTFVRHESARRPVPGMARLYQEVVRRRPDTFVAYLSTGAWNVAPALTEFLDRHGFPPGPLLLTDWGPTTRGWFRSGAEHKRSQLRRLLVDLPQLRWLLVGDDGQRDPLLYREIAQAAPAQIRGVALRQLTPSQQLLAHGTPTPRPAAAPERQAAATPVPVVEAPDGDGLLAALTEAGIMPEASDQGAVDSGPPAERAWGRPGP